MFQSTAITKLRCSFYDAQKLVKVFFGNNPPQAFMDQSIRE